MRRASALVVLGWAAWLTVLVSVLLVWTPGDWLQWLPFVAAAGGAWLLGLFLLLRRRAAGEPRLVPDLSPATVLVALGAAALLNGASFGLWLVLVGAGILAIGLAGLVRELLAARRARPRAGLTSLPRRLEE